MQAVLGDRRQQRDRPAEQHGEQVERDRPEQDRPAADEAQTLEGVVQRRRLLGRCALLRPPVADGQRGDRREPGADRRRDVRERRDRCSYSSPLDAGPTIMPNCHVAEYRAISRGSPPSGAISGGIDRIAG